MTLGKVYPQYPVVFTVLKVLKEVMHFKQAIILE